ncbi:MAG: hypothetical protein ABR532_02355 [Candidatus Dormibacteria bacterium]
MTGDRLFDLSPTERTPLTDKALVLLPEAVCPRCGVGLDVFTYWQPALFVACGYGAALEHRLRRCLSCGWELDAETNEVNPRGFR